MIDEKDEAIANLQELIDTVCDTGSLALERDGIEQELIMIAEHIENLIRENTQVAQDQTEYAKKEEKLRILYGEKHSRFEELESDIQEKNDTREILMNFIKSLQGLDGEQTEFREELWGGMVDHIKAENEKTVTVVF